MPGEDDGDGPRGQLPPFTPPRFNWNQDNLYEQFKNFKRVVEFTFKGQYEKCSDSIKCGSILNWLGVEAYPIMITCPSIKMTRKIQASYWMPLRSIFSLNRMFSSLGMLLDLYTVVHSRLSQNSITNSTVWPIIAISLIKMK